MARQSGQERTTIVRCLCLQADQRTGSPYGVRRACRWTGKLVMDSNGKLNVRRQGDAVIVCPTSDGVCHNRTLALIPAMEAEGASAGNNVGTPPSFLRRACGVPEIQGRGRQYRSVEELLRQLPC